MPGGHPQTLLGQDTSLNSHKNVGARQHPLLNLFAGCAYWLGARLKSRRTVAAKSNTTTRAPPGSAQTDPLRMLLELIAHIPRSLRKTQNGNIEEHPGGVSKMHVGASDADRHRPESTQAGCNFEWRTYTR